MHKLQQKIIAHDDGNASDIIQLCKDNDIYQLITKVYDYKDKTLVCLIEDGGVDTIDLAIIYHSPYYNLIIPMKLETDIERIARYHWIAVMYDNYMALDWLLRTQSIDINIPMSIYPLLHLAIMNNRVACISLLHTYNCDMNQTSRLGNPCDVARMYNNQHLIPMLKHYGTLDHEDQFVICQPYNYNSLWSYLPTFSFTI